ncbi:hypothetical protein VD659_03815 [Herbiconiux sp. 11R-BC]|uniref:hypothetical protein n=1 Tax=Herbiconiux sp. 11R-BC TaxID=3111637 RepID=UPI003C0F7594
MRLFLARGTQDDHYWVVQELDGTLIETPWRIEHEPDGYRLSNADDTELTVQVHALGSFETPELAIGALRSVL